MVHSTRGCRDSPLVVVDRRSETLRRDRLRRGRRARLRARRRRGRARCRTGPDPPGLCVLRVARPRGALASPRGLARLARRCRRPRGRCARARRPLEDASDAQHGSRPPPRLTGEPCGARSGMARLRRCRARPSRRRVSWAPTVSVDGTAPWIVLVAVGVALDLVGRARWGRSAGVGSLLTLFTSRLPGRLLLAGLWVFAGVHLFARYTIPGR